MLSEMQFVDIIYSTYINLIQQPLQRKYLAHSYSLYCSYWPYSYFSYYNIKTLLLTHSSVQMNQRKTEDPSVYEGLNLLVNEIDARNINVKPQFSELFIKIQSKLYIKAKFRRKEDLMSMRGTLCYHNGNSVRIPYVYRDVLMDQIKKMGSESKFFSYSNKLQSLEYRVIVKLRQITELNFEYFSVFASKITKNYRVAIGALYKIGYFKRKNPEYFKIKKATLNLIKNVCHTLSEKEEKQTPSLIQNIGKGCAIKKCFEIKQSTNHQNILNSDSASVRSGGYFKVEKKLCSIKQNEQSSQQQTFLAVKRSKNTLIDLDKDQQIKAYQKINKEFEIINQIRNKEHTLTYWLEQSNLGRVTSNFIRKQAEIPSILTVETNKKFLDQSEQPTSKAMYMDYCSHTLDSLIHCYNNTIQEILNYSKQIIKGVKILHLSGVVHRDLKPENFLVAPSVIQNQENNMKNIVLKIIDFGEATLTSSIFDEDTKESLGYTLPYSPIECLALCEEGYNHKKIDIWSVGLIAYQILFKNNPLTFSKCFLEDIYNGWKTYDQFCIFPNLRKYSGIRIIQFIVTLVLMHTVCIQQNDRISLDKMQQIYGHISHFIDKIKSY